MSTQIQTPTSTFTSKRALVLGGGGFIGGHLIKRLKDEGYWIRAVDLKYNPYVTVQSDEFIIGDLRDPKVVDQVIDSDISEIYQLAADMGGAAWVFTGDNDADIMHNSATINLNVLDSMVAKGVKKVFYSSSACAYPEYNQLDPDNPKCSEDSAYPAAPDSEYGWEKLFSERLYFAYQRNKGLDVRVARLHNIFGPYGSWNDGREKSPAALSRKIANAKLNGLESIDVWGSGNQTRSFLYVDECVEGIRRLMNCNTFCGPVNIGSEEMISINNFAKMIMGIAQYNVNINNIPGPEGVKGRNSDNRLIKEKLDWAPSKPLIEGMTKTYKWIEEQLLLNSSSQSQHKM